MLCVLDDFLGKCFKVAYCSTFWIEYLHGNAVGGGFAEAHAGVNDRIKHLLGETSLGSDQEVLGDAQEVGGEVAERRPKEERDIAEAS